MLIIHFTKK